MPDTANKKRLLLLQETIVPYRYPIYNLIAKHFFFTVAYINKAKGTEKMKANFRTIQLQTKTAKGVYWIKGLQSLCREYDAVITLPHLRCINFCLVPFLSKKYVALTWSIGVRASYFRPYAIDEKMHWSDRIYEKIMKKAKANIFYTDAPIQKWVERGMDRDSFFVAHNTVEVLNTYNPETVKDSFLFVGTLYKQKGVDELIKAYAKAYDKSKDETFPKLTIVGSGAEETELKELANSLGLDKRVVFTGAVFEEESLTQYFSQAILCISPKQAGLSVLKSMGYGVPYVTQKDAITGGEILNIKDGKNGIIYNTSDELTEILGDAHTNTVKYQEMGKAAYIFYNNNATPQIMADGVISAVEYALQKAKHA